MSLTTKEITAFKEKEAALNGDYSYNFWDADYLYEQLIREGESVWAERILKNMENAANEFLEMEAICEKLQEAGETEWLFSTLKKAEALAKDTRSFTELANIASKTDDKKWAMNLYKKAEALGTDFTALAYLGDGLANEDYLNDKTYALEIYKKAMPLIADEWDKDGFIISLESLGALGKDLLAEFYTTSKTS